MSLCLLCQLQKSLFYSPQLIVHCGVDVHHPVSDNIMDKMKRPQKGKGCPEETHFCSFFFAPVGGVVVWWGGPGKWEAAI